MEATKHGLVKLKEKENEILRKSSEIRNTLKGYSERHRRILNEKRRIQQLENELRMVSYPNFRNDQSYLE